MTRRISTKLIIDESIVLAALGASLSMMYKISQSIARNMILNEINAINSVNEDFD